VTLKMCFELVKSDVAGSATNTLRPLTHSLDVTKEGLAVDATQNLPEPIDLSCNRGVTDPEVRFERAVIPWKPSAHRPDLGPCLIYAGADNGNGYGQFRYNGRNGYAHRYAWERVHGPIADDLTVDHLCRVRRCVNIAHLELVEAVENYLRGVRTRNHCPNGHEYTQENIHRKRGQEQRRICKICKEETSRRGQARRTNSAKGLPDSRIKYDTVLRDRLANDVVDKKLTPTQAAEILGCNAKYMDKRARIAARARGIKNRRPA